MVDGAAVADADGGAGDGVLERQPELKNTLTRAQRAYLIAGDVTEILVSVTDGCAPARKRTSSCARETVKAINCQRRGLAPDSSAGGPQDRRKLNPRPGGLGVAP